MHRFFLPPEQCAGATLCLDAREAHHAIHVLRLRIGERVVVLDGVGHEFLCEVAEVRRDEVSLKVAQKNRSPRVPYRIDLLQAIPKGKTMETIVQKATELGAHRIVPILSERVVPHLDAAGVENKREKWHLAAIEAAKQSGSPWLPQIESPLSLKDYLMRGERFDLPLVASLQSDARHPRHFFQSFASEHGKAPETVCIWVGPEGDFTPAEMGAIRCAGAHPVTLGQMVLRSETAAVYCLSILNYELQSAGLDQHAKTVPQ